MDRHPPELGDCVCGLRLSSAGKPDHNEFTAAQLKTIQEVMTLILFCVSSALHLDLQKHNRTRSFVSIAHMVRLIRSLFICINQAFTAGFQGNPQ